MIWPLFLPLLLLACSPSQPLAGEQAGPAAQQAASSEAPVSDERNPGAAVGEGVANLPFAHGRRFHTLDEYLAHLERHAAPIDQPWWREISPGVYEHVKRMPGAPREVATRAELMQRFGFSK